MTALLYRGRIVHARFSPIKHAFAYPVAFIAVDLATLAAVGESSRVLGYNRRAALSIHDRDYLEAGPRSIVEKLAGHMPGIDHHRTIMITSPRSLLPSFNPLTSFFATDKNGKIVRLGFEVSNTFGERYFYQGAPTPRADGHLLMEAEKAMFVSPFHGVNGRYHFDLAFTDAAFDLRIDLVVDAATLIHARLTGTGTPLPVGWSPDLIRVAMSGALAFPRILRQALRLRLKGMKPVIKPHPPALSHRRRPDERSRP